MNKIAMILLVIALLAVSPIVNGQIEYQEDISMNLYQEDIKKAEEEHWAQIRSLWDKVQKEQKHQF